MAPSRSQLFFGGPRALLKRFPKTLRSSRDLFKCMPNPTDAYLTALSSVDGEPHTMNRREALQKLAAGGAIAACGSFALSSTEVAYAASPPGTGLVGVPGPGEALPMQAVFNSNGTVTITDASNPSCASGSSLSSTYAWTIESIYLGNGKRNFFVLDASSGSVITSAKNKKGCTNCPQSTGSTSVDSVILRKNNNGGQLKPLGSSDSYTLRLQISWYCSTAAKAVTAEYLISGSGSSVDPVQPLSYSVA
jgi:hypothetical protein